MSEKTKGLKYDHGKPRMGLLPWRALECVAKVLNFGAKKYESNNWQHLESLQARYEDAALRHYVAHRSGVELDEESGLPVLAHLACDVLFLLADQVGYDKPRDESYFRDGQSSAAPREGLTMVSSREGEGWLDYDDVTPLPAPSEAPTAPSIRPRLQLIDETEERLIQPEDLRYYARHIHESGEDTRCFHDYSEACDWAICRRDFADKGDVVVVQDLRREDTPVLLRLTVPKTQTSDKLHAVRPSETPRFSASEMLDALDAADRLGEG